MDDDRLKTEGRLLEARIAAKAVDSHQAIAILHQTVEENPNDVDAIEALSRHYLDEGRPQDAVDILARLVE